MDMDSCLECGAELSTVREYNMELCECCAETLGLFQLECTGCGRKISSEEYNEGNGICYDCTSDVEDDI